MATKNKKVLTTVFRDHENARQAYDRLLSRGYAGSEINVLMSDQTHSTYFNNDEEGSIKTGTYAAEGVATGGAIGTAVGATLASLAVVGAGVAIPGLGLFIAGPIVAALAGGGAGAVAGGALGGLIGMGIPASNADAFHQALKDGGVVVGVTPHSDEDADLIREDFEDLKGENIITT